MGACSWASAYGSWDEALVENGSTLERALAGYEFGRGAFEVVIGGRHRQLGRDVAIKLLTPALVQNDVVRDRFLTEARVRAALDHPHIAPVFDYVELDEACILVMERLVAGTVWRRFVDQGFDQRTPVRSRSSPARD